jgi:hypothetical protein
MELPRKPSEMFDRDEEWNDLARFAVDDTPGATLGVVSGRRRQGKTMLLYSLAKATGGIYFAATEATEADSLRRLGQVITGHLDAPAPLQLRSWEHATSCSTSARTGPPWWSWTSSPTWPWRAGLFRRSSSRH